MGELESHNPSSTLWFGRQICYVLDFLCVMWTLYNRNPKQNTLVKELNSHLKIVVPTVTVAP